MLRYVEYSLEKPSDIVARGHSIIFLTPTNANVPLLITNVAQNCCTDRYQYHIGEIKERGKNPCTFTGLNGQSKHRIWVSRSHNFMYVLPYVPCHKTSIGI